ncbi:unnamed protein product [Hymenolepis diminuta]|uniref:Gag-pro-like protein n=2 Tax=Hymenolepis diminuta TaxID=6216 RepID=A0A0R3SSD5_HYMDI|nr:unnamed protein product [Hymenolepis diminuta]
MVFGVPLKLGQFLSPSNNCFWSNPLNYVERLRSHVQNLQPHPTRPVFDPIFFLADLKTCSSIFLPLGAVRKPLQPIYVGPFKALPRDEKTFTILQNGQESVVSMDRVKPAYLDKLVTENASPVFHPNPSVRETKKPISVTHSGRHVCFPDRYKV